MNPDRTAVLAMAIGSFLDAQRITQRETLAVLATVFSVSLEGLSSEVCAELCELFTDAVMSNHRAHAAMTRATTPEQDAAFEAAIAREEDEARRIAKRDGVPDEWIETVLAKLRGKEASRA